MEGGPVVVNQEGEQEMLNLPPGFRFHPTDEEIITHYLTQKIVNPSFTATAIGEVDLNKSEPWDLPKKAKMGEKEWFFFCQRDRKYPTGMRTNRATELGYWKATGKDKEIYRKAKNHHGGGGGQQLVGMKKTLVFYKGRAPKGEKSNWVMHEFRLDGKLSYHNFPNNKSAPKDEWVVCKVFHKNAATMMAKKNSVNDLMRMNTFAEELLESPNLPQLMDSPYYTNTNMNAINTTSSELQDLKGTISYPPSLMQMQQQQQQQHGYMITPTTTVNHNSPSFYNYDQMPNSMLYSQNANNFLPYQSSSSLGDYFHQQRFNSLENIRPCKVEQYSSNLSRSQDTGLSTDLTAEISSSKQEVDGRKTTAAYNHNQDVEGSTSVGHLQDLDSFWNFQ